MSGTKAKGGKPDYSSAYMNKFYGLAGAIFLATLIGLVGADAGWLTILVQLACLGTMLMLIEKGRKVIERGQNAERELQGKLQSQAGQSEKDLKVATDRTRQQELQLEKQLKLSQFPLSDHFGPFMEKLKSTDSDQIEGLTHTQFMELYIALEETFKRNNRLPLSRLADIPEDVRRVNQIETLIDLYGKKMQRVRADDSLDEEDRDHKIANWERMMERDISKLEET